MHSCVYSQFCWRMCKTQTQAWRVFLLQTDLMFLLPLKHQALASQVYFDDRKKKKDLGFSTGHVISWNSWRNWLLRWKIDSEKSEEISITAQQSGCFPLKICAELCPEDPASSDLFSIRWPLAPTFQCASLFLAAHIPLSPLEAKHHWEGWREQEAMCTNHSQTIH